MKARGGELQGHVVGSRFDSGRLPGGVQDGPLHASTAREMTNPTL